MSPHRMRLLLLPLVGVVASGALALDPRPGGGPEAQPSVLGRQLVKGDPGDGSARPFEVWGDVAGLAPGVTRPLHLRLVNPNDGTIAVQDVGVRVGDSPNGCSGRNLLVAAFRGPVLVPGGGGVVGVTLPVTLAGSAPPSCQGAVFPLTYAGSAVKA